MNVLNDAWFWAFVAMFGLHGATFVVSRHRLSLAFVTVSLAAVTTGRLLLVLPFCPQPRFDVSMGNWIIGGVVILTSGVIGIPTLSIAWWRAPTPHTRLRTSWPYSMIRHPMYLSEFLWPIGWSVVWGSIFGLALTPMWCIAGAVHVLIEEDRLEELLGERYREYQKNVPCRFIPWLL